MMQRRGCLEAVVLLGCVGLVAGCASLPRGGRPTMSDVQFRMRDFRLQNGMRILVEEDHASPLVGVVAVVGVGSSGDPAGREGLAHLVEHLAFRSRLGGGESVWTQLEAMGVGALNATTSLDATTYFEVGSRDLLPRLLTMEAGRLLDPLAGVDQKAFEVEREVVRNELRQRGENALGPAFNYLQEAVFPPGHRYARPPIGTHQSLSAITLEDARAFAAQHYRPANLTLVVIGDVDLPNIQLTLGRTLPGSVFQPLPPTPTPFPARISGPGSEPPAPPPFRLARHPATVASPELYLVWSLPRAFDTETVMLDFVTLAAQRELGSAFFADPDIVGVSVFSFPGAEASMLVARVVLQKGDHVERSSEKVLDQLVKLWVSGSTGRFFGNIDEAKAGLGKELALARLANGAVTGMMLDAEDLLHRGVARAQSTHLSGDPVTYSRLLRAMGSLTATQVTRYAEAYLQRDRARAVLLEPYAPDARAEVSGPTGLAPVTARPLGTPLPPAAVRQLGRAHLERGKSETVVRGLPTALVETLPNGLRVVVRQRRNALPVVAASLTFPTGSAATAPRGAAELAHVLGFPRAHAQGKGGDYGIAFRTQLRPERSSVLATGGNGNVGNLLAQLAEQVTSMTTEAQFVASYRTDFAGYLALAEQLPVLKAERALRSELYAGHPLAETPLVADQLKLSAGEVVDWYRSAWTPRGAVLVVAGDIDATATLAEVRRWFGGWSGGPGFPALPPPPLRTGGLKVVVTHQPNATQAQLRLACLAEGATSVEELAGRATADLLATELVEKVRGELGASYGFQGQARPVLGGVQVLEWAGSIENPRLTQGLQVLASSLQNFERQLLTEKAVERARWSVARELTVSAATTTSVAAALTRRVLAGRDTADLDTDFEDLATVGKEQLLAGWRQCQGSLVLSVLGDEQAARTALTAAGLTAAP